MRTSALSDALSALIEQQLVSRDDNGYRLAETNHPRFPFPFPGPPKP